MKDETPKKIKLTDKGLVDIPELEERNKLALKIKLDIDAGIETQGSMGTWWLEAERAYLNEAPSVQSQLDQGPNDPGYQVFTMPLTQTRVDMLSAQVTTVVTKQDPLMTDISDDEDVAEKRQKTLHRVLMDGKFPVAVSKVANMCGVKDIGIYRITPGLVPGSVKIDAIDPQDWTIFPATPEGIQAAACVGHRTNHRRIVVQSKQKTGEYYETEDLPESTQADHDDDHEQVHTRSELSTASPDKNNQLIEIWDVVVRLDLEETGNEQLYRASVDYDGCQLLSLQPYKFSYIWYFRSYYIGSSKYFYSGSSVARNLDPCQTAKNNLFSAFYGGSMSAAMPKTFGPPLESGEKFTKAGYGDYIPTEGGQTPFTPGGQFSGQAFPSMLQIVERDADMVSRVSQNTQGAQATGQTTATEQSIIAAGVAVGLEMFIANFTSEFPEMAAHTMELIADDYEAFEQRFGTIYPDPTPEELEAQRQDTLQKLLGQAVGQPPMPDQMPSPDMNSGMMPQHMPPIDQGQPVSPIPGMHGPTDAVGLPINLGQGGSLITGAPSHIL